MKIWAPLLLALAIASLAATTGRISIKQASYYGWPNSVLISNGVVEAIVVPAIGRVMQFRFVGDENGPFWENVQLRGKVALPYSDQWANFGGDKVWPAPQSDWATIHRRAWPPPDTFDSLPLLATVRKDSVELTSATDVFYGVWLHRIIELDKSKPVMTIKNEYHKKDGSPVRLALWTITQLQDPEQIRIPTKGISKKPPYRVHSPQAPPDLTLLKGMITLTRNPLANHKIGSYGESLIWIGKDLTLEISSPRQSGDYPDEGSSTEVYTSADPSPYVELEMLGPLKTVKKGDRIAHTVQYKLSKR
jgi:hypothetical protein